MVICDRGNIHDPEQTKVGVPALIARRLLPTTVTTLFFFGWLGLWLVHVGTFGAAIFVALDIVVFTAALILCVRTLRQLEDQKRSRDELAKCVAEQTTELTLSSLFISRYSLQAGPYYIST